MKAVIYRSMVKLVYELIQYSAECEDMDNQMDGSGECGDMIHKSHNNWLEERIIKLFEKYKVDLYEFVDWLLECARIRWEKSKKDTWDVKLEISYRMKELFHEEFVEVESNVFING